MKVIIGLLISLLSITACTKTVSPEIVLNGKYRGTFQRVQGSGNAEKANVSITFNNNSFTGTSDILHYPAICNGTYSVTADSIHFVDLCVWTADFDWTLILTNKYSLRQNGDSLEIKREYAGQKTDVYKLKKDL